MMKFLLAFVFAIVLVEGPIKPDPVYAHEDDGNDDGTQCEVFRKCTPEQMDAFLNGVCGEVTTTSITTTTATTSTTSTTLDSSAGAFPCPVHIVKVVCRWTNKLGTHAKHCKVDDGSVGLQCGGSHTRRDGSVVFTNCVARVGGY